MIIWQKLRKSRVFLSTLLVLMACCLAVLLAAPVPVNADGGTAIELRHVYAGNMAPGAPDTAVTLGQPLDLRQWRQPAYGGFTYALESITVEKTTPAALEQPAVITGDAVNVLGSSASIINNTYSGISGTISFVTVQYSTSASMASSTTATGTIGSPYMVNLTGLQPDTTYYYRASVNTASEDFYGEIKAFKTALQQPAVITGNAVDVLANSASIVYNTYTGISGDINFVSVQYSTSPSMASLATVRGDTIGSPYTVDLTGLQPNTTYYYRAALNTSNGSVFGAVKSFTTPLVAEARTITVNYYTEKNSGMNDYIFYQTTQLTASDGDVIISASLATYLGSSYVFSHASPDQLTVSSGSNVINLYYKIVRNSPPRAELAAAEVNAAPPEQELQPAPAEDAAADEAEGATPEPQPAAEDEAPEQEAQPAPDEGPAEDDKEAAGEEPQEKDAPELVPETVAATEWALPAYYSGTTETVTFTNFSAPVNYIFEAGSVYTVTYRYAPLYSITYNGNDNTGGSAPVDGVLYRAGNKATVLGQNTLSRSGHDFNGWNTKADGSGVSYNVAAPLTVSGNVTLYAQWKVPNTGGVKEEPKEKESKEEETKKEETVTEEQQEEQQEETQKVDDEEQQQYQSSGTEPQPQERGEGSAPPPPAISATSGRLILNQDNSYELIGDDGVPLGRYTLDEDGETWIFEPYVPLGNLPQTGAPGITGLMAMLALIEALAMLGLVITLLSPGKRQA